jgi:hypothetical protein
MMTIVSFFTDLLGFLCVVCVAEVDAVLQTDAGATSHKK